MSDNMKELLGPVIESPVSGKLGWEIVRGRFVPVSADIGVGPYFSNQIMHRINQQKSCNVIFCGEPGISKTYTATSLAKYVQPTFKDDQIAYTFTRYMELQIKEPEGHVIVMDEPEYIAGHREWYQDVNKALVATTRSGRFKVHPLFIPTINKSLLDKVIRKYLLQYMVWMDERGEGTVYRISPNKFDESVMHIPQYKIRVEMLDTAKCEKPWCLNCRSFTDNSCQLLRAQYERRRKEIQTRRYQEDLERSRKVETAELSTKQLEDMALRANDKLIRTNRGTIDPHSLMLVFEEEYHVLLNLTKATNLSRRLALKDKRATEEVF